VTVFCKCGQERVLIPFVVCPPTGTETTRKDQYHIKLDDDDDNNNNKFK
jgi:hypothetical protein